MRASVRDGPALSLCLPLWGMGVWWVTLQGLQNDSFRAFRAFRRSALCAVKIRPFSLGLPSAPPPLPPPPGPRHCLWQGHELCLACGSSCLESKACWHVWLLDSGNPPFCPPPSISEQLTAGAPAARLEGARLWEALLPLRRAARQRSGWLSLSQAELHANLT